MKIVFEIILRLEWVNKLCSPKQSSRSRTKSFYEKCLTSMVPCSISPDFWRRSSASKERSDVVGRWRHCSREIEESREPVQRGEFLQKLSGLRSLRDEKVEGSASRARHPPTRTRRGLDPSSRESFLSVGQRVQLTSSTRWRVLCLAAERGKRNASPLSDADSLRVGCTPTRSRQTV